MSFLGGILAAQDRCRKSSWGLVGPSVGDLGRPLVAQMVLLGCLWRVLGDHGAISVDLGSKFVALRSIPVDLGSNLINFGSNLVPLRVDFRCSFAQVGRVVRRRAEPHFDSVWASRNDVPRLRARAKNRWKIVPVRLLAQVTQQLICERYLFRVRTPQNGPQELSGAPREASPGPLGRSRVALGAPSGALERSRGALGTLLERSWGDHERSWERLDEFGPSLGRFLALWESILTIRSSILGSQRISFGVSARYACDTASDIEFRNDLLPFFA